MRIIGRCLLVALLGAAIIFAFRSSRNSLVASPRTVVPSESAAVSPATSVAKITTGLVRPSEGSDSPVARFETWSEHFLSAPTAERDQLTEEGKTIGLARRQIMESLIKTNPQAALAHAVSDDVRREMPQEIQNLLEERVSGRGFYGVLIADNPDEGRREIKRHALLNDRQYDAYVYGRRSSQMTRESENMWGVAIGKSLALSDEPIRPLTKKESARLDPKGNCPVSGVPATTYNTPAFGEIGGTVERFCGARHLAAMNERLAADGGLAGEGGEPPIAHDGWTQGPRTVLFMRVAYPDDPTETITEAGAYSLMDSVSAWFAETSYNTTWLVTDVTPLIIMPKPKSYYCERGDLVLLSEARIAARDYGFDTDNYHLDIVRFPSPGGCSGFGFAGQAYVGGKGCWMLSNASGVQVHELGHNYGVWHANSWTGAGDSVIGNGTHTEYGNPYDVMGSSGGLGQFNANFKNTLDWMHDAYVHTVISNGTYRLFTFDVEALTAGQKYALKIRKDYDRNYWAEFRRKNANVWFLNGIILNWDPWVNSVSGTHLLDTTPGSPAGNSSKDDCAVVIGRTYSDVPSGIHMTPIARGDGSMPENWIDVVVNLGNFPSNSAPTSYIIADRTSVATNSVVNFTSVASDPDRDTLAYAWDFGDQTFGPNAASVSRSWSTPGHYVVRCTVSDMKGGIHTKWVVVTVGSPTTFRASGRVMSGSTPVEGVRVHNGLSGSSYRGSFTDSDGYFTVAGLAAGSFNLSAVKYGYALPASGWANPVAVGPDAINRNFNATPLTAIGFTLLDTNMGEASLNPGVVRITRQGDTNSAVTVQMNRSGTAIFNTDYTMAPAPAGTPLSVSFPAGVTNIDITLTPVADTASEGPELITLTLTASANYVLAASAEVTLVLTDDESPVRPTVFASTGVDNVATESGNDPGVFTLTRIGNIANELLVYYSIGGTATSGVDFTPMSGVASIPAGQTTAAVTFNALDDAEVELNETVTLTVLSNAAYNSSAGAASVTIPDDDPVTVTVIATDDFASESGNNATVVFDRIGSFAGNLVVNYALSGSATSGDDYTTLSGSITIPAGRPNASLTIAPINDSLVEGPETVNVQIVSSATYNVGNPGGVSVTIEDNDVPTVTLIASDAAASETGPDIGSYRFTRTLSTSTALTVSYNVGGEATPGSDYQALSGSVTFAAGITSVVVNVTPINDSIVEIPERVLVTLRPGPAYVVGTAGAVAVTISDNDASPSVPAIGFLGSALQKPENETSARLLVRLSSALGTSASVNYTVSGTATGSGTDYTLTNGVITFSAGVMTQALNFTVSNDSLAESDETLVITLSNPVGAALDVNNIFTYTIVDDDASVLTITTPDATANEAGLGTGTFRIVRSGSSNSVLTVNLQVLGTANAPTDYASLPTSIVIPAGSNYVDLLVTPVNDSTDEPDETVIINLLPSPHARLGSPDLATITIVDDDNNNLLPIVRVDAIDSIASEPGVDTGTFRVSRDRGTNTALTVEFTVGGSAVSGTDYTNLGTTVTLPIGVSSTNLVIFPRNDSTFETNETIVLALTTLAAYRVNPLAASATVTLVDDEQGVTVSASGVAGEGGSTVGTFVLTRTGSTVSNLNVNFRWAGTASTTDFSPNATNVVIPAGASSAPIVITASSDSTNEGAETLVLMLSTNAAYIVLTQNTATILLVESDFSSPWNLWRAANFTAGELNQPFVSGADADPDGDGLRNLLEYAHNRNPRSATAVRSFLGRIETLANPPGQRGYVIRFTRRKAPTDLNYEVQVSDDFSNWQSGAGVAQEIFPATDDGNGTTETAAFVISPNVSGGQKFVRLRVTLVP